MKDVRLGKPLQVLPVSNQMPISNLICLRDPPVHRLDYTLRRFRMQVRRGNYDVNTVKEVSVKSR